MRNSSGGFTLLEVLVAFAIAAIGLAALYGGVLTGMRAAHVAGRETRALGVARSHIAMLDPPGAVAPGMTEGDEAGGYHWTMTVVPRAAAERGGVSTVRPLVLYDVSVTVRWSGEGARGRTITLVTRRTGAGTR